MEARLRRSEGVVAGCCAMGLATAFLGFAHIVQGSVPFPQLGLAQRLLHVIPGPLAVFSIERLGHWALRLFAAGFVLGSIAVGGIGGAIVAGRPQRRLAAALAAAVIAALAVPGYRAESGGPSLQLFLALVAVAALIYATSLLAALDRLAVDRVPAPAQGTARTRREVLRALAGVSAMLVAGVAFHRFTQGGTDTGPRPLVRPAGAAPIPPARVPAEHPADTAAFAAIADLAPEVTRNAKHYVVDESILDPHVDTASWRLRFGGLVRRPIELSYSELLGLPGIEQFVTLQCISNEVGGDLVGTARWTGVPLADLIERAGGLSGRPVRVVFHAVGGYTDSLPVAKALDRSTIIAYGMNGDALPRAHGYPARVIAPGIYGMKNVKWLERIEVVDYDYKGYWQRSAGWDNVAEIKTTARIDAPADASVAAGATIVAGAAWAGVRGVRRVEVSLDDGRSWQPAILRRELAQAAWRQWRFAWTDPTGGLIRVRARAFDGRGGAQIEAFAPPYPNGSTGYDQIELRTITGR